MQTTYLPIIICIVTFYDFMSNLRLFSSYIYSSLLTKCDLFVKDGNRMKLRKLLEFDSLLDYEDAGANGKHDPRKKPGNGGGRNP